MVGAIDAILACIVYHGPRLHCLLPSAFLPIDVFG